MSSNRNIENQDMERKSGRIRFAIAALPWVVIVAIGFGGIMSDIDKMTQSRQSYARQQGIRAAKAGVAAEANPYRGAYNKQLECQSWLDGWISTKEKK